MPTDHHVTEGIVLGIAAILALGVGAQWAAWRLGLPSVLLLMGTAFVVGPVFGWLDPDTLLGPLLTPLVSLSVGVVLLEGGLSLEFSEIKQLRGAVGRIVTVGAAITWVGIAVASYFILSLPIEVAILFGALLTVTGPTVIVPMLRTLKIKGSAGTVAKWEGIVNDPLMVVCAVLVFEAIVGGAASDASTAVARGIFMTVFVGGIAGFGSAWLLQFFLKRHWVPDYLHIALTLGVFGLCFAIPNMIQQEAGLAAVTIMGVVLANQRDYAIRHIIEFKENVRTLLISALFIVLTARLSIDDFLSAGWASLLFAAALIFVVRPAAVMITFIGSSLKMQERIFLAWLAPRGIVAASLAAIFADQLVRLGYPEAERLTPVTIVLVAVTVATYGLTSPMLARRLGLSLLDPQGLIIMGGHEWARRIGKAVKDAGFEVLVVDTNWKNVSQARMDGLKAYYGSLLSEETEHRLDISGMGRIAAMTRNDEANALACMNGVEHFGRARTFQLSPSEGAQGDRPADVPAHVMGRILFAKGCTFDRLSTLFATGWEIRLTSITDTFKMDEFRARNGEDAVVMFLITPGGALNVATPGEDLMLKDGSKLIALVPPEEKEAKPD